MCTLCRTFYNCMRHVMGLTVPARLRLRTSTTVDGYPTPVPARMHEGVGEHLLRKSVSRPTWRTESYGMLQCSQVDAPDVSGKPRFTLSVHDMQFVIVISTCCASTHCCALTTMSPSPGKSPINAPESKASPMWPGGTAKPAG